MVAEVAVGEALASQLLAAWQLLRQLQTVAKVAQPVLHQAAALPQLTQQLQAAVVQVVAEAEAEAR